MTAKFLAQLDTFTVEIEEAWAAAYQFLAKTLIDKEKESYAQPKNRLPKNLTI